MGCVCYSLTEAVRRDTFPEGCGGVGCASRRRRDVTFTPGQPATIEPNPFGEGGFTVRELGEALEVTDWFAAATEGIEYEGAEMFWQMRLSAADTEKLAILAKAAQMTYDDLLDGTVEAAR